MLIHAKIPEGSSLVRHGRGFYTTYDVVADSPEEGLGFVQSIEDEELRSGLIVEEFESLEPRSEEPKGVYRVTSRMYYENE